MVVSRHSRVLLAAWLLLGFESAFLIAPASVLPLIIDRFTIGPIAAGWIVSAFFAGQVVASIPVGMSFDLREEFQFTGIASLGLFSVGILGWWAATAESYWLFVGSRVVGGVAGTAIVVATMNIVGQTFPTETEGTAVALLSTGGPAGIALGQFTGPLLTERYGWEIITFIYSCGAVVSFFVLWLGGQRVKLSGSSTRPELDKFGDVLTNRNVWLIGTMYFSALSIFFFLSSWMPSYLTQIFEFDLARSGLFLALFTITGVVARSSGGLLSDRVFNHRRRPVVLLSFVVTTVIILGIVWSTEASVLLVLLVVGGFFIQQPVGVLFTHIREVVEPDVQGTAVALFLVFGTFGALTAPVITGALIDYANGYTPAFGYIAVLASCTVAIAWYVPEDQE